MLEFLKSPYDVLAVKFEGKITGEDLDLVMDRMELIMAKHDKINLYVETHDIKGFEVAAFPSYFQRAFPLFGKLSRFGRVAVVADQAWIRVVTRFESALLPYVSYRVYEPKERKEALDWAFERVLVDA